MEKPAAAMLSIVTQRQNADRYADLHRRENLKSHSTECYISLVIVDAPQKGHHELLFRLCALALCSRGLLVCRPASWSVCGS